MMRKVLTVKGGAKRILGLTVTGKFETITIIMLIELGCVQKLRSIELYMIYFLNCHFIRISILSIKKFSINK